MGFFKKLGKKLKKFGKKVGKGVGKAVNAIGKVAAATGIPIISQAGKLVDAVIPDNIQKMAEKVAESGVLDAGKVEETIRQQAPADADEKVIQESTKQTVAMLSKATDAPIDDSNSATNISMFDKVKQYLKKPLVLGIIAGVVAILPIFGSGKRKKSIINMIMG